MAIADSANTFDNKLYSFVLKHFVQDGWVDYAALKKDRKVLDKYVNSLGELTDEEYKLMSETEQIAFWINAYNAITLKVIVDHYPIKPNPIMGIFAAKNSIMQIPGAWDRIEHRVKGEDLTLNNIEHEILRKEFNEPRIHFALVCASISCPVLSAESFTGERLEEQLEDQTQRFYSDSAKVRFSEKKRTLFLSPIFEWYGKDFGGKNGIREFSKKYLPQTAQKIKSHTKIKYLPYDWNLNDKQ